MLALGSAAVRVRIIRPKVGTGAPRARARRPTANTSAGWTKSLSSATGRKWRTGVRECTWLPARNSTAPIVNSATGVAESPSMRTICATGAERLQSERRRSGAEDDRPGQRIGQRAAQRDQRRMRRAPLGIARRARRLGLGDRQAERAGHHQVEDDGADHRAGGGVAEQRHQQRHAHEAGVRERRHQRAEGGIAQVDAARPARVRSGDRDRQRHHQHGATSR